MNKIITLSNINKKYHTKKGEITALEKIDLDIYKEEIISLVGPSGCGKTTLLSIIAGLDHNYGGKVNNNNLKIAYMLQTDALLPYLTIFDNAILGLKIKNMLTKENIEYVNYLFNLYNLDEFKNQYPNSLSGGMRQRCALIRTLSLKPDILLLDEPFSALDSRSKLIISDDLYQFAKNNKITIVLVTHDIEEAIYFSDRIVIFSKRPSSIKKILNININNNQSIYERKKDVNFYNFFDLIWKELDSNE